MRKAVLEKVGRSTYAIRIYSKGSDCAYSYFSNDYGLHAEIKTKRDAEVATDILNCYFRNHETKQIVEVIEVMKKDRFDCCRQSLDELLVRIK